MKTYLLLGAALALLAASFTAEARSGHSGHHYPNQGGHYQGGHGSSHKGGHYKNPRTHDHYTHHK